MKKFITFVGTAAAPVAAFAQAASVPTAESMTTSIGTIGPVAGAAAALGLSIWVYRKVKSKAGQAIG